LKDTKINFLFFNFLDRLFHYAILLKGEFNVLNVYRERRGDVMSVYKIIEIVGTSPKSWEDAAQTALRTATKSLEDLRVAEVVKQDVTVEKGKITAFRVRLNISFKYKGGL
jgi:hypothetical protein